MEEPRKSNGTVKDSWKQDCFLHGSGSSLSKRSGTATAGGSNDSEKIPCPGGGAKVAKVFPLGWTFYFSTSNCFLLLVVYYLLTFGGNLSRRL